MGYPHKIVSTSPWYQGVVLGPKSPDFSPFLEVPNPQMFRLFWRSQIPTFVAFSGRSQIPRFFAFSWRPQIPRFFAFSGRPKSWRVLVCFTFTPYLTRSLACIPTTRLASFYQTSILLLDKHHSNRRYITTYHARVW